MAHRRTLAKKRKSRKSRNNKSRKTNGKTRRMRGGEVLKYIPGTQAHRTMISNRETKKLREEEDREKQRTQDADDKAQEYITRYTADTLKEMSKSALNLLKKEFEGDNYSDVRYQREIQHLLDSDLKQFIPIPNRSLESSEMVKRCSNTQFCLDTYRNIHNLIRTELRKESRQDESND